MHWHSHWERVFGKARGRKRYIQLSRLKSKKQKKKIVKSQFVKLAIRSIQKLLKTNKNKQKKSKKKQTAMDAARMEPEGYLTTTVPHIKQTNKKGRRLKLENKYLKNAYPNFLIKLQLQLTDMLNFKSCLHFKLYVGRYVEIVLTVSSRILIRILSIHYLIYWVTLEKTIKIWSYVPLLLTSPNFVAFSENLNFPLLFIYCWPLLLFP